MLIACLTRPISGDMCPHGDDLMAGRDCHMKSGKAEEGRLQSRCVFGADNLHDDAWDLVLRALAFLGRKHRSCIAPARIAKRVQRALDSTLPAGSRTTKKSVSFACFQDFISSRLCYHIYSTGGQSPSPHMSIAALQREERHVLYVQE